jgi:catechol 2,3-dioxygenase-like lactoylglutathione lyase family enzyme
VQAAVGGHGLPSELLGESQALERRELLLGAPLLGAQGRGDIGVHGESKTARSVSRPTGRGAAAAPAATLPFAGRGLSPGRRLTLTKILHLALARTSEAASDRLYVDLLGLEKRREKQVDAELCHALFGVARAHRLIDYAGDGVQFEVFLVHPGEQSPAGVAHVCLEVGDAAGLVERCKAAGLEVREAVRGERRVTFVVDEDGNLYEIKQANPAP